MATNPYFSTGSTAISTGGPLSLPTPRQQSRQVTQDTPPTKRSLSPPAITDSRLANQYSPYSSWGRSGATDGPISPSISNTSSESSPRTVPSTPSSVAARDTRRREHEYNQISAELQRHQEELKKAKAEYRALKQSHIDLEQEYERDKQQILDLQKVLADARRELQEYKALSDSQGKELLDAQALLSKVNSLSAPEAIVDKVNALNDEVFQTAASLADSFAHKDHKSSPHDMQAYYDSACEMIGEPITKVLSDNLSEMKVKSILVQIVLQVLLSRFCSSKIELWYLESLDTTDFLSGRYGEIRRAESQAASGKWRTLDAQNEALSNAWSAEFLELLRTIKRVSGWSFLQSIKQEDFIRKLNPIFKAVEDLRTVLVEQTTSADIEVFVVSANVLFSQDLMEDAWGGSGRVALYKSGQTQDLVAGTTGIGLRRITDPAKTYSPVLMPKVILLSTLQDIIEQDRIQPQNIVPVSTRPVRKKHSLTNRGGLGARWWLRGGLLGL